MSPKVSVIIPVYNAEKYLHQCLDSVINQSLRDIEIICIDDGSTDSSPLILSKYTNEDPRLKIITQSNMGQAIARNNGLDFAQGEFIAFVDADDWLEINALEKTYNILSATDCDYLVFRYNPEEKARDVLYYLSKISKEIITDERDRLALAIYSSFTVWNKLYRHEFIKNNNIKFPSGFIWEDINFNTITSLLAHKIITIPDYLYNYRYNPQSTTANRKNTYIIIKMYQDLINLINEKCKSLNAQNVVKSLMYFHIYSHRQSTPRKFIKNFENELSTYLNLNDFLHAPNNVYLPPRIRFYYLYIFNKAKKNILTSFSYWFLWQLAKIVILPRKISKSRIQMEVEEIKLLKNYKI